MAEDWKSKGRERLKERTSGANYKLAEGSNTFRILPNPRGKDYPPIAENAKHANVGPDKRMVTCGKNADGKGKCWLCDIQLPKLQADTKASKRALAKEMERFEVTHLNVSTVNEDTGKFSKAKPWMLRNGGSKALSTILLNLLFSPKRRYEDPVKGYNITINRTGSGMNDTRYGVPEPDDEPTKVPQEVLQSCKPLEEVAGEYNEQEQKDAFFGRDSRDAAPSTTSKKKRPPVEEDDEDDDPDEDSELPEDSDDEDDEDEAPKKKGKKTAAPAKKKAKVQADEDEDEDESDDEDEDEDEDSDESEDADEDEDSDDDDSEDEDDESDDEDEDSDEDDEDEDEDEDDDEDEAPPAKKGKAPVKGKAPAKAAPPAKKAKPAPAKKGLRK